MTTHRMPAPTLRPPLKWYGGKRYLAHWIISHFPKHRMYLEAFGGGGSVLLNKEPAEIETYNDLDHRLTRFFRVLRDHGAAFRRRIQLVPYSQVEFHDADTYPPGASDVDKAVCDFIRWRQSFAGKGQAWGYSVRRSRGGMAGDVHGWWSAIDQLPEIISRLKRVQIIGQSAFEAIPRFDDPDALIYCDPPYVQSVREAHSRTVYRHEMSDEEHRELARVLRRCKASVIVSGYPSPLYDELYRGWRCVTKNVASHAAGGRAKTRKTECLWMNFTQDRHGIVIRVRRTLHGLPLPSRSRGNERV